MIYDYVISKPSLDEFFEHFNPFHNPKNGQFASKSGGVKTSTNPLSKKPLNEMTKEEQKTYLKSIDDKELREYAKNKIKEAQGDSKDPKVDKQTIKSLSKNSGSNNQKIVNDIESNSEYKKALEQYKTAAKKDSEEFNSKKKDPKNLKLADEKYKQYYKTDKVDRKSKIYDMILGDIASGDWDDDPRNNKKVMNEAMKSFKKDYGKDADPSENKYFDYYVEDAATKLNWKSSRKKSNTQKEFDRSIDNLMKVEKKVVSDYLGEYSNKEVGRTGKTYNDMITSILLEERAKKLK